MRRDSGQLASAAPSAPTATGTPDHALVPVMLAAMMPPTAMPTECPVLPQTWAAKSVASRTPRRGTGAAGDGSGDTALRSHRVRRRPRPPQRRREGGEVAEQRARLARIDDLLDPEGLGRAEGGA